MKFLEYQLRMVLCTIGFVQSLIWYQINFFLQRFQMSGSQPRGDPLKGFQKGGITLSETLRGIEDENRIETRTRSHLFSETHPTLVHTKSHLGRGVFWGWCSGGC
jgi:hypothetical protein